jgi:hypothetical protein
VVIGAPNGVAVIDAAPKNGPFRPFDDDRSRKAIRTASPT